MLYDDIAYSSLLFLSSPAVLFYFQALLYKKYSTDSDVWSYAMVLFEIWTVGKKPFSMHTNNEVLKLIQSGYVQAPPPGCPREIYKVMVDCWLVNHSS